MQRKTTGTIALVMLAVMAAGGARAGAQAAATPYPTMAPLDEYLIADRDAEIALARSAAPASISGDAAVMVLGRRGYETAVEGKNGFVCAVFRGWTAGSDDPVFWNPKNRSPICFNAAAARTYLPIMVMRTQLLLAGQTKAQAIAATEAAMDAKQLPPLESGAMCFMMSKQQYLNDGAKNWHPHMMFFVPQAEAGTWGANVAGSPVLATDDKEDRLTIFMIPVGNWSDGTAGPMFHQ